MSFEGEVFLSWMELRKSGSSDPEERSKNRFLLERAPPLVPAQRVPEARIPLDSNPSDVFSQSMEGGSRGFGRQIIAIQEDPAGP